jgi:hypothetical protein
LAGQIVVGVQDALNCAGDPLGTGRHNLKGLRGLASRTADAVLRDEPRE